MPKNYGFCSQFAIHVWSFFKLTLGWLKTLYLLVFIDFVITLHTTEPLRHCGKSLSLKVSCLDNYHQMTSFYVFRLLSKALFTPSLQGGVKMYLKYPISTVFYTTLKEQYQLMHNVAIHLKFCNTFIICKIRSTPEQMPALVFFCRIIR
jgi:hypothetical protein